MKILLGTQSKDKEEAVNNVFNDTHDIICCSVKTGVREQSFGLNETARGAMNRVENILNCDDFSKEGVKYVIGIESGLIPYSINLWFDIECINIVTLSNGVVKRNNVFYSDCRFVPGISVNGDLREIRIKRHGEDMITIPALFLGNDVENVNGLLNFLPITQSYNRTGIIERTIRRNKKYL